MMALRCSSQPPAAAGPGALQLGEPTSSLASCSRPQPSHPQPPPSPTAPAGSASSRHAQQQAAAASTALYEAAEQGDLPAVLSLLAVGADANRRHHLGMTALLAAARAGHSSVVQALLAAPSVKPLARDAFACTAAHHAAFMGHAGTVEVLVRAVPDGFLSARDCESATPLHRAVAEGQVAVVRLLLGCGAHVDARDAYGKTPLMYAATAHSSGAETIPMLVRAGADAAAADSMGQTALHLAAEKERCGASVGALLAAGAPAGALDATGRTPLVVAAGSGQVEAMLQLAVAAKLQGDQAHLDAALCAAARWGQAAAALALLAIGASATSSCGTSSCQPLHLAVRHGHVLVAKALIAAGADVEARDGKRRTPLHLAAAASAELVQVLLAAGASPAACDAKGLTPLDVSLGAKLRGAIVLLQEAEPQASTPDQRPRPDSPSQTAASAEADFSPPTPLDMECVLCTPTAQDMPNVACGSHSLCQSCNKRLRSWSQPAGRSTVCKAQVIGS